MVGDGGTKQLGILTITHRSDFRLAFSQFSMNDATGFRERHTDLIFHTYRSIPLLPLSRPGLVPFGTPLLLEWGRKEVSPPQKNPTTGGRAGESLTVIIACRLTTLTVTSSRCHAL